MHSFNSPQVAKVAKSQCSAGRATALNLLHIEVYADLGRTLSQLSAGSGGETQQCQSRFPASSNLQNCSMEEAKHYNGC